MLIGLSSDSTYMVMCVLMIVLGILLGVSKIGIPSCKYIFFLNQPDQENGVENLARYLAERAGCRNMELEANWKTFVPAAAALRKQRTCQK